MKIFQIFFILFNLINLVIAEPATSKDEFMLGFNLITYLKNHNDLDLTMLLPDDIKNQLKGMDVNSKEFLKTCFDNLQNNKDLNFDDFYQNNNKMQDVLNKIPRNSFKNGLNRRNVYGGKLNQYKDVLENVVNELESCYNKYGDNNILNDMKSRLENIRNNRYKTMKSYFSNNNVYSNNGVTADDNNYRFLKNNQEFDLDQFNKDNNIRRNKIDMVHYRIVVLTRNKASNINNILNSKC